MRKTVILLVSITMVLLAACGSNQTSDNLPTATSTPTPTLAPSPTQAVLPTAEPTATSTPTPVPTATATPSPTPVPTATSTPVPTATPTVTSTPTATPSPTPVPTATSTPTPMPTATPTPSPTPVPTATSTPVPTATATPSPTPVPTATSTPTPAPTATSTPVPTEAARNNEKGPNFNGGEEQIFKEKRILYATENLVIWDVDGNPIGHVMKDEEITRIGMINIEKPKDAYAIVEYDGQKAYAKNALTNINPAGDPSGYELGTDGWHQYWDGKTHAEYKKETNNIIYTSVPNQAGIYGIAPLPDDYVIGSKATLISGDGVEFQCNW